VDELVANEDLTYDEVDWDKLMGLSVLKRICGNAENDEAKYYVPDWFPTDLVMTTNLRELDHIINIRTRPDAWRPFYDLCHEILKAMPLDHLQVIGLDHLVKVDEYVSRGTGHGLSRAVKSEL
jgi:hypothetical protein